MVKSKPDCSPCSRNGGNCTETEECPFALHDAVALTRVSLSFIEKRKQARLSEAVATVIEVFEAKHGKSFAGVPIHEIMLYCAALNYKEQVK